MDNPNTPLWQHEFSAAYAVPAALDQLVNAGAIADNSWHHDVCPHFEKVIDADTYMALWIEHPDPQMRENGPAWPRFGVAIHKVNDSGVSHSLYNGDDETHALETFLEYPEKAKAFLEARKAFAKAAIELSNIWNELSSVTGHDMATVNYPFAESFDELTHKILDWSHTELRP